MLIIQELLFYTEEAYYKTNKKQKMILFDT